jgi:hypothetical protein
MSGAIDLSEKLSTFSEHWSPRTVTQFNDCDVMVVKVKGEFVWHKHDDTDDFFLVLKGVLDIQLSRSNHHARAGADVYCAQGRGTSSRCEGRSSSAVDRTSRHAQYRRCRNSRAAQDGMTIHRRIVGGPTN